MMCRRFSCNLRDGSISRIHDLWLAAAIGLMCTLPLYARGVDSDRWQTPQDPPHLLEDLNPTQLRIPITVSWQMTTSRLLPSGTSTISQTYRETWLMEVSLSGEVDLKSPRDQRPVFVPGGVKTKFEIPKGFLIEERDLAALVGIGSRSDKKSGDDGDPTSGAPRLPILINLARPPRAGTDLSIYQSDVEHHEVHLDFGSGVGL